MDQQMELILPAHRTGIILEDSTMLRTKHGVSVAGDPARVIRNLGYEPYLIRREPLVPVVWEYSSGRRGPPQEGGSHFRSPGETFLEIGKSRSKKALKER